MGAYTRYLGLNERFSAAERSYALGQIAWQAATRLMPDANPWFKAAGDTPMSEEQAAWRVRAALRAGDWRGVKAGVEAMPAEQRKLPDWTYWLGRAQMALGNRDASRLEFERIAGHPTFYGILADEELGRGFTLPKRPAPSAPTRPSRFARPRRAARAGLVPPRDAHRRRPRMELDDAQPGRPFPDRRRPARPAARHLRPGHQRRRPHQERARLQPALPRPYRERIEPNARNQSLDPGWVYGLMRQESRFVTAARSSVGAQGLMQIMPATGQWVAGKLGMKGYHIGWLRDPDTNVMLGTTYMRMVLEGLDNHPVLASAAYNAGPGRPASGRTRGPWRAPSTPRPSPSARPATT
jgi:soluble lytic murein transglycosylase